MPQARNSEALFGHRHGRGATAEQDAADLGTAFGLDLSLAPSDPPPAAAAPRGWRLPSWMQWLARCGPGVA